MEEEEEVQRNVLGGELLYLRRESLQTLPVDSDTVSPVGLKQGLPLLLSLGSSLASSKGVGALSAAFFDLFFLGAGVGATGLEKLGLEAISVGGGRRWEASSSSTAVAATGGRTKGAAPGAGSSAAAAGAASIATVSSRGRGPPEGLVRP